MKPEMILFDYGQTLINESHFDPVKGVEAVMKFVTKNPHDYTSAEIQEQANQLNKEIGRFDPDTLHTFQIEVHNHFFQNYLYESLEIEFSIGNEEIEEIFWSVASPPIYTEGILEFIDYLKNANIRVGIISNISFSGKALRRRMEKAFPTTRFEFIIASSDFVFRKPNPRIFQLALQKANLKANQVWYCGDQVKCDIAGAVACGMKGVWYKGALMFPQECGEYQCLEVDSWKELENQIERL